MNVILIYIIYSYSLFSQVENTKTDLPIISDTTITKEKSKHIVTIGKVEYGSKIDLLPLWKIDAAMNLIGGLTNKFSYFPFKEKLDYIDSLKKSNVDNPLVYMKDSLGINWIFNLKINKLQNILGVNLTAISLIDSTKVFNDNGFAYLNLRDSTNKNVYDVSLTNALQRAISKTLKDSTMFSDNLEDYKVFPFPTLVVGGLEFKNNEKMSKWSLFTDKQVTSFDVAESIWEEVYNQKRFVAFDIESRDSLYTLFNMYGVENYDAPTPFELKALNALEVEYFITGSFERASPGGIIKIHICQVEKQNLKIISTGKIELEEDSIIELRKKVKKATKQAIDKFREING